MIACAGVATALVLMAATAFAELPDELREDVEDASIKTTADSSHEHDTDDTPDRAASRRSHKRAARVTRTAASAPSQDNADTENVGGQEERPHYDWSVGAGIGVAGIGGLAGPGSQLLSVLFERRLGEHVWLLASARASYNRSQQGGPADPSQNQSEAFGVGAAGGLRFVINPDDPFQFSAFAVVGYQLDTQSHEYASDDFSQLDEFRSWRVSGRVGGAIERELLEGFGLRLAMDVAQVGYGPTRHQSFSNGAVVGDSRYGGWSAGLALTPSLEARMKF